MRKIIAAAAWACVLLFAAGFVAPAPARAETIAIVGTGNVGGALGRRLAEQGHRIIYGSRTPDSAAVRALVAETGRGAAAEEPAAAAAAAEVVILAVRAEAIEGVVAGLGDLSGKIVVDPTNPRITAADGYRDFAFDGSNAERVQRLAPGASVVKAFSTLGARTMLDPSVARGPVTVPVVGDDRAAKAVVVELARSIGLEGLDVGPLRHARILEGLHFLRWNAVGGPIDFHLRPEAER